LEILETEENENQIFYEEDEIAVNKANQAKDQFEEILKMRLLAAEPKRNKFNIMDYKPIQVDLAEKLPNRQSNGKDKKLAENIV